MERHPKRIAEIPWYQCHWRRWKGSRLFRKRDKFRQALNLLKMMSWSVCVEQARMRATMPSYGQWRALNNVWNTKLTAKSQSKT